MFPNPLANQLWHEQKAKFGQEEEREASGSNSSLHSSIDGEMGANESM